MQDMSSSQSLMEMFASTHSEYDYLEDACTMDSFMGSAATEETAVTDIALASFPATVKRPQTDTFKGKYNFDIQPIKKPEAGSFVYSQLLDKVFTNKGTSVHFNLTLRPGWESSGFLFIRALPVFLPESESFEEVVKMCPTHENESIIQAADFPGVHHIIRCTVPQTQYQLDPETGRYSVVTFLSAPQPGASGVTLLYSFVCKNSCRFGIARRALALIFTLESNSGEIYGRRLLEVRVCSCPKRDKNKEEDNYRRNVLRDQSHDVLSETKHAIKQLTCVSRCLPQQEVPQTQVAADQQRDSARDSAIDPLQGCGSNTDIQRLRAEKSIKWLSVRPVDLREMKRQAAALIWKKSCENHVPLSETDAQLLHLYKEDN